MCCKNNRGRFYRDFTVKPSLPASPSLLRLKFILGERIDKYIRRTDQLEYTAPTGFRFLDEPMFCFSTLNANTNPNPNCRPGHRPWPLTPWKSLPGRRPWPLTLWQSLPGHRPWLLILSYVLAARVGAQADTLPEICMGI